MASNIVARITANGEALVAETSRAFGLVQTMARNAGRDLGEAFGGPMAEGVRKAEAQFKASYKSINDMVAGAVRTNGGLQIDLGTAKAALASGQERLANLRELAAAVERVAAKESDASAATRAYITAARAAVTETEREVNSLNDKVIALEKVQTELGGVQNATARANATSASFRAGAQQLGYQLGDVATQFASGTSAVQIFGQQIGQVQQAVGLMTNSQKGLVGFLAGPWGAALTAGVTVLAGLYAAHQRAGEAAEKQGHKELTLKQRIDDLNKSLRENIRLDAQRRQDKLDEATTDVATARKEVTLRNSEISRLNAAIAEQKRIAALPALTERQELTKQGALQKQTSLENQLATAKAALAENQKVVNSALQAQRAAEISITNSNIAANRTAESRAQAAHELALARLQDLRLANKISADEYARQAADLDRQNQARLSATEKQTAAARTQGSVSVNATKSIIEAQRDLVAVLDDVTARYDPLRNAVRSYDADINKINELETAGAITAAQAWDYRTQAGIRYRDELTKIREALDAADKPLISQKDVEAKMQAMQAAVEGWQAAQQKVYDQQKRQIDDLAGFYERAFASGGKSIWQDFKRQGQRALGQIAAQWTMSLLSGSRGLSSVYGFTGGLFGSPTSSASGSVSAFPGMGAIFGQQPIVSGDGMHLPGGAGKVAFPDMSSGGIPRPDLGSVGTAIGANILLGRKSNTGSMIGGALGSAAFKALAPKLFAQLGSFAGPMGTIAGTLLGSVLGGIGKKKGSATLGFSGGALGVVGTSGNQSRSAAGAEGLGGVSQQLQQIAEALGATLDGPVSLSLGMRGKNYRLDTTGKGRTKGAGVLDFGQDQQAAIQAALSEALKDGVLGGISEASKRIMASGKDVQKAIQQALSIESIPKLLKQRLDPVGVALEAVDKKFAELAATLKEAGASAEQVAQARQLYELERKDAMSTAGGSNSLRNWLTGFSTGSGSPFSLRDQRASAESALKPFLDQIGAGTAIDVDKYMSAAQSFLDIERQIEGSRPGYFASLSRIQDATQRAISQIDGQSSSRTTKDPFAELTAKATQTTADLTAESNLLLGQMVGRLARLEDVLSSGSTGFIGQDRGFLTR